MNPVTERLNPLSSGERHYALLNGTTRLFEISPEFSCYLHGNAGVVPDPATVEKEISFLESVGYFCSCEKEPEVELDTVFLHVAHTCNLACDYCNVDKGRYKGVSGKNYMSPETARDAVDFIIKNSRTKRLSIVFWGGEPLLNLSVIRDTVFYSSSFDDYEWSYDIQTNGTLIDGDCADFFAENGFQVNVSIDVPDGSDARRRDTHRNATYENVGKAVDLLHSRGVKDITITCTLMKDQLGLSGKYYDKLRGRFPNAQVKLTSDNRSQGGFIPLSDTQKNAIPALTETRSVKGISRMLLPQLVNGLILGKLDGRKGCPHGAKWVSVSPDGNISVCSHTMMIPEPVFNLGNVRGEFNRKNALKAISLMPEKCSGCFAKSLCPYVGCHITRFMKSNPPQEMCNDTFKLVQSVIDYISGISYEELFRLYVSEDQEKAFDCGRFLLFRKIFRHIRPFGIRACAGCGKGSFSEALV